jgi:parvulin-like peptidyl-prolyl isomerase
MVVRDGDDAAEAQACAAGETRSIEIDAAGPAALVALATMPGECAAAAIAKTVLEAPLKGRPKAASCAVHELFRTLPPGPRAVAVVRIETDGEPAEGERPAKRARVDETRVRCRQILIKHSGSKKPQDLQRKPVKRTLDAAIQLGLQAVRSLGKGEGFMPICRQLSECPSKLRGGEMAGDIGWLDREKGADVVEDANKTGASVAAVVPTAILGPAFSLTVGQLSDLVLSEEGVHILQRTA